MWRRLHGEYLEWKKSQYGKAENLFLRGVVNLVAERLNSWVRDEHFTPNSWPHVAMDASGAGYQAAAAGCCRNLAAHYCT